MSKTKALLIAAFVVTFAAGATVGWLVSGGRHPHHGPSWLAAELDLTNAQREQMRQIWADGMREAGRNRWDQRRALAEQRDQAIADLLTDDQRARYESILQDYETRKEEGEQERRRAFEQAVERTKQILTPEQAAKYEQMLKRRPDRGRGGKRRGPPPAWDGPPPPRGPHEQTDDESAPPRGEE